MRGAGGLEALQGTQEDPHEHRNCLWDGCDYVGLDLVLLCSGFLGMQIATHIVAHLLVPLHFFNFCSYLLNRPLQIEKF